MEFFKQKTKIDFMRVSKWNLGISLALSIISIIILFNNSLNFGLEFTGGIQIELQYKNNANLKVIEDLLHANNIKKFRVQHYGSSRNVLIRVANGEVPVDNIKKILQNHELKPEIRMVEFIDSEVGEELADKGAIAVILAILATMVYIAVRFEYRFAISSAISLCHDAIIMLGIFSLFQINFDLATLAAVLAMLGYSLNDTVVIFDRVRENFRRSRKGGGASEVMNLSINQTLSRTIMTSLLTLVVVLPLLFFGGESLFGFSVALLVGILIGTYSSIYIAGSLAIMMGLSRNDLVRQDVVKQR